MEGKGNEDEGNIPKKSFSSFGPFSDGVTPKETKASVDEKPKISSLQSSTISKDTTSVIDSETALGTAFNSFKLPPSSADKVPASAEAKTTPPPIPAFGLKPKSDTQPTKETSEAKQSSVKSLISPSSTVGSFGAKPAQSQQNPTPFGKQTSSLFGKAETTPAMASPSPMISSASPMAAPSSSIFGQKAPSGHPGAALGGIGEGGLKLTDPHSIETRIREIYQTHNPNKVDEIPNLLEKYQADLPGLLDRIEKKYLKTTQQAPLSQPATSGFGNFASQQKPTPFAQQAPNKGSPFGSKTPQAASAWGGQQQAQQQQPPVQQSQPWGTTNATTTGGLFGGRSSTTGAQNAPKTGFGSGFGASAPAPAFGQPSNLGGGLFGSPQASSGSSSPFPRPSAPTFGNAGGTFGGGPQQSSAFGGGKGSVFGQAAPAPGGAVGSGGFGGRAQGSMFGGASQTTPSNTGAAGFGKGSQGSLFGGGGGKSTYSSPAFSAARK